MTASALPRFGLRAMWIAAVVCATVTARPLGAFQGQGKATKSATTTANARDSVASAAAAERMKAEEAKRLRDDVNRLKIELDLRQQLWNVKHEASWPGAIPWIVLGALGVLAALLLFFDQLLARKADSENKMLDRATDWPKNAEALSEIIKKLQKSVVKLEESASDKQIAVLNTSMSELRRRVENLE